MKSVRQNKTSNKEFEQRQNSNENGDCPWSALRGLSTSARFMDRARSRLKWPGLILAEWSEAQTRYTHTHTHTHTQSGCNKHHLRCFVLRMDFIQILTEYKTRSMLFLLSFSAVCPTFGDFVNSANFVHKEGAVVHTCAVDDERSLSVGESFPHLPSPPLAATPFRISISAKTF
jgi:hypothetical protein